MGWISGSKLAESIWSLVRDYIPQRKRKKVALDLIDLFENMDCDTIDECVKLCRDAERQPGEMKKALH